MEAFSIALLFGLGILLIAVMYLAAKIQKLHRHTRHLRYIVQKLEGAQDDEEQERLKHIDDEQMGGG